MKFYILRNFFIIILFHAISLPCALAGNSGDFMRETGKIYVAVAVLLVIFLGIVAYLFRLDRKLTKLEHQTQEENEWKN